MIERVLDALAHQPAAFAGNFWIQIAAQGVSAQWKRQPVCLLEPTPEIDYVVKSRFRVGELRLVNDQAGVGLIVANSLQNLIERRVYRLKIRLQQSQRQIRRREPSGY